MKGLEVVCPNCGKCFHETSDEFDPYVNAHGGMVRLKDPWRKWMWSSFGDDGRAPKDAERKDTTRYPMMTCPQCCGAMAAKGKMKIRNTDGSEFIPGPKPVPINNLVDGKLVFPNDYSDLEPPTQDIILPMNYDNREDAPAKTETRDEKILRLRGTGLSFAKIGKQVGLSKEGVRKIIKANA